MNELPDLFTGEPAKINDQRADVYETMVALVALEYRYVLFVY